MKPRMRQRAAGSWQCKSRPDSMAYVAPTAAEAYVLWLGCQTYVVRETVGNVTRIDRVDIHERRMARGMLGGD